MVLAILGLFLSYENSKTLRSSGSGLLLIPKVRKKTHGEATIYFYAPEINSNLPVHSSTTYLQILVNFVLYSILFGILFYYY